MECANAAGRRLKGVLLLGRKRIKRLLHFLTRHHGLIHRLEIQPIEAVRVFKHGLIATGDDVLNDRFCALRDLRIHGSIARNER